MVLHDNIKRCLLLFEVCFPRKKLLKGLLKYNSNGITVYNSANSIIRDENPIWDIAVDSKDNVWIGCEGLIKYNGNEFIHYNSTNTSIPEDVVFSIAIDSKDHIWFTPADLGRVES